jgi:UDPglucose--hexose-1-phosphate uridylyltransferase
MDLNSLKNLPHRRYNPLIRRWVLVSPHRTERPWQGQTEPNQQEASARYDPHCYLCPGNVRAGDIRNPEYTDTFVFDNDFAALCPAVPKVRLDQSGKGLLVAQSESGLCRVVCFSPRHDLTIAQMSVENIRTVVDIWADQYRSLGARRDINYVQIFENRGAMMGCSNPHPHCQIWANETLPDDPAAEQAALEDYCNRHRSCLLCDYIAMERASGERIVVENEEFLIVVPFWAIWPFETLLLSKRHLPDLDALDDKERTGLASVLKQVTMRYDKLFDISFPYSMGLHQRPTDGREHSEWHFHAHYFPPLLRSATIRKFMVGYELLASPQRDITAETAAALLRQLPIFSTSGANLDR